MAHDRERFVLEVLTECIGHVHAAMLSARATDGNCQIVAILRLVGWKPLGQELLNVGNHFPHVFKLSQIISHGRV